MRILGYDYTLHIGGDSDVMDSYGRCLPKLQRILVASDLTDQAKITVVLHEVLEALKFHLELNLDHNVLSSLESGLFQVLTDSGVDLTPLVRELMSRGATE